jgi:hypothetical protein
MPPWIGGSVGPRPSLDAVLEIKITQIKLGEGIISRTLAQNTVYF